MILCTSNHVKTHIYFYGSRFYGRKGVIVFSFMTFVVVITVYYVNYNENTSKYTISSVNSNIMHVSYQLYFNHSSRSFDLVIYTAVYLIIFFTYSYLFTDKHLIRVFVLLCLFHDSILSYIYTGSLIFFFISWEMLGFISSLLVCYWKNNPDSILNGIKAVTINRIGDYSLSLALYTYTYKSKSQQFYDNHLWENETFNTKTLIYLTLGVAVLSKSAQYPFHTWLYHAMSAPTPISSLLHAATMVTAGSFILVILRLHDNRILYESYFIYPILFFVGITIIITSLLAFNNFDIKRILAFSTSGQLAIICISLLLNSVTYGYFHLISHAIFKCCVFLSIANIIHSFFNNQDLRLFYINPFTQPITTITLIIGSCSMIGFPLYTGFFSKEYIISYTNNFNIYLFVVAFCLLICSTVFTCYYTYKLITSLHGSYPNLPFYNSISLHEGDLYITSTFTILILGSIIVISYLDIYDLKFSDFNLDQLNLFHLVLSIPIINTILISTYLNFKNESTHTPFSKVDNLDSLRSEFVNLNISKHGLHHSYFTTFKLMDKYTLSNIATKPKFYYNKPFVNNILTTPLYLSIVTLFLFVLLWWYLSL